MILSPRIPRLLFLVAILAAGCGKKGGDPTEISLEKASSDVKSSFSSASPEIRQAAEGVAQSMQSGQIVESYVQLEMLSQNEQLTLEQRQSLGESRAAVLKKVTEAAAAGDAEAAKALESHQVRK